MIQFFTPGKSSRALMANWGPKLAGLWPAGCDTHLT
ncbi:hypothetical protein E2C01_075805 [Portunus trituberculatus]|uniref:Uncharacterized protein n=1 Tax=Portunus trituberculatus TaxID=210409 RepID=A0A5B7IK43_PORTR|nr:hypothetical protein [Portunus trituberculatus]